MIRRTDRRPADNINLMGSTERVKFLSEPHSTDCFWQGGPLFAMAAKWLGRVFTERAVLIFR